MTTFKVSQVSEKTNRISHYQSLDSLIGHPTFWKISEHGIAQFRHEYDSELLEIILNKALALKEQLAHKRHLNLRFIRGAQRYIPEINQLIFDSQRLNYLSEIAQVELEPYPISVVQSIITFMGPEHEDGALTWHTDGIPATELIPLEMKNLEGGELMIFLGNHEVGKYLVDEGLEIRDEQILKIKHRLGSSSFGQYIRVLHRTAPIQRGYRVTLNLNLRSKLKPYIDDNTIVYLGADNIDPEWVDEFVQDAWNKQLPAYRKHTCA